MKRPDRDPVLEDPDEELHRLIGNWHRTRWAAVGVLAGVLIVAILLGGYSLMQTRERLAASCNFYRDLGVVTITVVPPARRPSEGLISLIVDARVAWAGQGCPGGPLPPASPALRHWAAYYHLPRALR
jgi:hypothetical protein